MRWRLIPREEKFYADFISMADELERASGLLEEMLAPNVPEWGKADQIKDLEHRCDFLTHEIMQRLNRTFVTPIDREDIHALASSLDDVMDAIDDAAGLIRLYRLDDVREGARELAKTISASVREMRRALAVLEQMKGVEEHAVEMNRLENEADRIHQQAVRRLFESETNPVTIIKWKETFDFLEEAVDKCEDVANVIESVIVKHG
jgi:predicted phosphate transport protein (TIGR00153 family)